MFISSYCTFFETSSSKNYKHDLYEKIVLVRYTEASRT